MKAAEVLLATISPSQMLGIKCVFFIVGLIMVGVGFASKNKRLLVSRRLKFLSNMADVDAVVQILVGIVLLAVPVAGPYIRLFPASEPVRSTRHVPSSPPTPLKMDSFGRYEDEGAAVDVPLPPPTKTAEYAFYRLPKAPSIAKTQGSSQAASPTKPNEDSASKRVRTWTSRKGKRVEAELLEYDSTAKRLRLRRTIDGNEVTVSTSVLSDSDVEFVEGLYAKTPLRSDR